MAQTDYVAYDPIGVGSLYSVNTTQKWPLGQKCKAKSATYGEAEFIYLKGVASTAIGSVVTYDEAGVTALLAANAKGPVAVATCANDAATTFAWYCIKGKIDALCASSSADNGTVGRETSDGTIGDGRAAGDQILGVIARSATDTPAPGFCWLQIAFPPFVDDFQGA